MLLWFVISLCTRYAVSYKTLQRMIHQHHCYTLYCKYMQHFKGAVVIMSLLLCEPVYDMCVRFCLYGIMECLYCKLITRADM